MFTAGRYEYRNKGVDMFIESLARELVPVLIHGLLFYYVIDRSKLPPSAIWFEDDHRCIHRYACHHNLLLGRCSERAGSHETTEGHRY